MLIVTRRVGESVMIGDEVAVTVLGVKGNQVRIGINAPKNVTVHREEIFKRIHDDGTQPSNDASVSGHGNGHTNGHTNGHRNGHIGGA